MRHWIDVPEEVLEEARRLKAGGMSWNGLARHLRIDRDVLRHRVDPQYAYLRKTSMPPSGLRALPARLTEEEIAAMLAEVPTDTRGLTARVMGDPLPGRSALDKKMRISGPATTRVFPAKMQTAQRGLQFLRLDIARASDGASTGDVHRLERNAESR